MGANNFLRKCGEVLIDLNSKDNKNKDYVFHCIFCNIEYEQLNKFSLHIEEEHFDNFEDAEVEHEFEGFQTFNSKSSIENEKDINLDQDVLNIDVKEEAIAEYNAVGTTCAGRVKDCNASMSHCDEGSKEKLVTSKRSSDTSFPIVSDTDDEIEDDVDPILYKRRKLNFFQKRAFTKLKDIICEMSSDESTDEDCHTLERIFINSTVYPELRSYYDKYGHLGSAEQNKLSRTIIDYYVGRKVKLPSTYLKKLASEIVKLFPSESEEVYFEKHGNRRPKGKLYFRYQNMMKLNAKPHNKIPPQLTAKRGSLLRKEKGASKIKSFLEYNCTNREETLRSWKQCIEYRLKELTECEEGSIANVIYNWPAYKQSFGPELVSIDFDSLFPGKSQKFSLNWTKLNMILPTYFNMNLKDLKLKSIWLDAKERWAKLDQNSKDALFIYIIHGILKPRRFSTFVKVTIAESQLATIKFIEDDIQPSAYAGHSPFLLIKKSYFAVDEIFVVAEKIIYKMNTVAEALSLCFKIHKIFHLEYNTRCVNFWLFVQKVLFEIHFEDDYAGNSLRCITSFFESQK